MLLFLAACSSPSSSPSSSPPSGGGGSPECGAPVAQDAMEVPSLGTNTYGSFVAAFAVGAEGALVAYLDTSPDPALGDSGIVATSSTCLAVVVDAAGAPVADPTPIACGARAVALADGFLLATPDQWWRFRSNGEAVPLFAAERLPLSLAAADRGDGVRSYSVEYAGTDLRLVTRDLADDASAVEVSSIALAADARYDDARVSHDGTDGILVVTHWAEPGATWYRVDSDGALVGGGQPLDVEPGWVDSTRVDDGVHRMVFATGGYNSLITELTFAEDVVVGPSTVLVGSEQVQLQADGSLLGVLPYQSAFVIPLVDGAFGARSSLALPLLPYWLVDGPAGIFAVGEDDARDLEVTRIDGTPNVVDPAETAPCRQEGPIWQATASDTLVVWQESGFDFARRPVGVWLDPSGAPSGSPAELGVPGTQLTPLGVATPAGTVWMATVASYPLSTPSEVWAIGPDLQPEVLPLSGVGGPGTWLGDRAILPMAGGAVASADQDGQLLDQRVVDATAPTVAVVGDADGALGLVVQRHANYSSNTGGYWLTLQTVGADLALSAPAEVPDAYGFSGAWTCGPGCWIVDALTLSSPVSVEVHAAGSSAPTTAPSALGWGPVVAGTCGYTAITGVAASWTPDLATPPTPLDPSLEGRVVGLVPGAIGDVLAIEFDGGRIFVQRLTSAP